MLLKTVKYPSLTIEVDSTDLSPVEHVNAIRDEFMRTPTNTWTKEETVSRIGIPYTITHVKGDETLPKNCIAFIVHTVEGRLERILVTDDMEAYIISETGVTVSVINKTPSHLKEACGMHNRGITLVK